MNRREFLKFSIGGLALCSLSPFPLACMDSGSKTYKAGRDYVADTRFMAYDRPGNAYEIMRHEHKVRRLDESENVIWEAGGRGDDTGELNYPMELLSDPDNLLYVVDHGNSRIVVYDRQGFHLRDIGMHGEHAGDLNFAKDVVLGNDQRLYVCDSLNHRIGVFDLDGTWVRAFGEQGNGRAHLNYPVSLDFDSAGDLHILDKGNARVQVFGRNGVFKRTYGAYGKEPGELLNPGALVIDRKNYTFISDAFGKAVSVFDWTGTIVTRFQPRFSDGRPAVPIELAWRPDGLLHIAAFPDPYSGV